MPDDPLVPPIPLKIITVRIRAGLPGADASQVRTVEVWNHCPECGGLRGTPHGTTLTSAEGTPYVVDTWANPCGHVDLADAVLHEAEVRRLITEAIATHNGAQLPVDAMESNRAGKLARMLYERYSEALRAAEREDWTEARRLAEPVAEVGVEKAWELYWKADVLEGP